jgi:cell division protein FtsZ
MLTRRDFIGRAAVALASVVGAPRLLPGTGSWRHVGEPGRRIFSPLVRLVPRTLVVGLGGAGLKILEKIPPRLPDVRGVAVHTDERVLRGVTGNSTLLMGAPHTRGFGCGSSPVWGRLAAEGSAGEVAQMLHDADPDVVFLLGGMGGGTFTGGAPVIAGLARDTGALAVAVVTRPFTFEGRRRNRQASLGLPQLVASADAVITIPNDAIIEIAGRHTRFCDPLDLGAEAAASVVHAAVELLTVPGHVNVDFADLRAVLQGRGLGSMGVGVASPEEGAEEAARRALASPYLRDTDLHQTSSAMVQIAGEDLPLDEISRASHVLYDALGPDAAVMLGDTPADAVEEVRVTVVALGGVEV